MDARACLVLGFFAGCLFMVFVDAEVRERFYRWVARLSKPDLSREGRDAARRALAKRKADQAVQS